MFFHLIHLKIGSTHSISHLWSFPNFLSSFLLLPPLYLVISHLPIQSPFSLFASSCLTCCLAWCVMIGLSEVWCEPYLKWLI